MNITSVTNVNDNYDVLAPQISIVNYLLCIIQLLFTRLIIIEASLMDTY